MGKKLWKKIGLAFDSSLKLISDAPGKNLLYIDGSHFINLFLAYSIRSLFSCEMQLYERFCLSVGPWVCRSVSPWVTCFSKTANSKKFKGIQVNQTKFATFRNYWPVGLVFSCEKQLYKRVCPLVCQSLRLRVRCFSKTVNSKKFKGIQVNSTKVNKTQQNSRHFNYWPVSLV